MTDRKPIDFEIVGAFEVSDRTPSKEEFEAEGVELQAKLSEICNGAPRPVIMEALTQFLAMMVVQSGELSGLAVMSRSRLVINALADRINSHFEVMTAKGTADRQIKKAVAKTMREQRKDRGK